MDLLYTPCDDLPERLCKAMRRLQRCTDTVNTQVHRAIDVAVSEWQKAEGRVVASAAKTAQEEQWAEN